MRKTIKQIPFFLTGFLINYRFLYDNMMHRKSVAVYNSAYFSECTLLHNDRVYKTVFSNIHVHIFNLTISYLSS